MIYGLYGTWENRKNETRSYRNRKNPGFSGKNYVVYLRIYINNEAVIRNTVVYFIKEIQNIK